MDGSNAREKDEPRVDLDSTLPRGPKSWLLTQQEIEARKTCRRLWEAIPLPSHAGHSFTDFWSAYQAVIRSATSIWLEDAETSETAHVERWNTTHRPRAGSLMTRKTLSFSPIVGDATSACLKLFLHRYTRERAISLL